MTGLNQFTASLVSIEEMRFFLLLIQMLSTKINQFVNENCFTLDNGVDEVWSQGVTVSFIFLEMAYPTQAMLNLGLNSYSHR